MEIVVNKLQAAAGVIVFVRFRLMTAAMMSALNAASSCHFAKVTTPSPVMDIVVDKPKADAGAIVLV